MSRFFTNPKPVTALLGVLLVLSGGVQSIYPLCLLSPCSESSFSCEGQHDHEANCGSEADRGCGRASAGCRKMCCGHDHNQAPGPGNGCPCSDECLCKQSPQPSDLPRRVANPFEQLVLLLDAWQDRNESVADDHVVRHVCQAGLDRPLSPTERCVRLGRFLI